MKKFLRFAAAVLGVLAVSGCENISENMAENAAESSLVSDNFPQKSEGAATFLTGPDGREIYTSEITFISSGKSAEELSETDAGTMVFCEGFQYFKKPTGVCANNYSKPEWFDNAVFGGELPENEGEFFRVYEGEEICGLRLKKATALFCVNEKQSFAERHYKCAAEEGGALCEFEGETVCEGFLAAGMIEPKNNAVFIPAENKFPLLPAESEAPNAEKMFETRFRETAVFGRTGLINISEFGVIDLGEFKDIPAENFCSGEIFYVRVKFKDLACESAVRARAKAVSVEVLSRL